jgi:SAM-dependent methyltransferase
VFSQSAAIYDLVYGSIKGPGGFAAEADVVEAVIRARNPAAASLLDVACGTGAHLEALRSRFREIAGTDLSAEMLAQARARLGEDVDVVQSDMRHLSLGRRFDAITCLFSAVGYLPDVAGLDQAIAAMARHLNRGGVLVVDGWVLPEAWRGADGERNLHPHLATEPGRAACRMGLAWREGKVTHVHMEYLVADAAVGTIEHLSEDHTMVLFSRDEYLTAFERAGLHADILPSAWDGRDRYVAVNSPA